MIMRVISPFSIIPSQLTRTEYNDRGHDIQFVRTTSPKLLYFVQLSPAQVGAYCLKEYDVGKFFTDVVEPY